MNYIINTEYASGGEILHFSKKPTGFNHIVNNFEYAQALKLSINNTLNKDENGNVTFSFVDYRETIILSEKEIRSNIQTHLDRESKKWGYDNIYTAIGYRGDPNPEFNQEAEMFFKWRSAVWTYTNVEMDKVKAGTRDMPTTDDNITSELPKIEDYE